jgi:hypothetical protein
MVSERVAAGRRTTDSHPDRVEKAEVIGIKPGRGVRGGIMCERRMARF